MTVHIPFKQIILFYLLLCSTFFVGIFGSLITFYVCVAFVLLYLYFYPGENLKAKLDHIIKLDGQLIAQKGVLVLWTLLKQKRVLLSLICIVSVLSFKTIEEMKYTKIKQEFQKNWKSDNEMINAKTQEHLGKENLEMIEKISSAKASSASIVGKKFQTFEKSLLKWTEYKVKVIR